MTTGIAAGTTGTRSCLAIVLAAGVGTRMRSFIPKVLHQIAGQSLLAHVLASLQQAGANATAVVVGPGREDVAGEARRAAPSTEVFVQGEQLGTAHAVLAARAAIARGFDDILVVFADTPLVLPQTFANMRAAVAGGAGVAALGFEARDPSGYGRFIVQDGALRAIREHKDASPGERAITLCNAGLMALDGRHALAILERIGNRNAQSEYYLTDAVEVAQAQGLACLPLAAAEDEVIGVNDRVQLAVAEALLQHRLRLAAMRAGVTMTAPETVFLCADTQFGQDVVIEPHVVFGPGVKVSDGVVIHAFCHLEGATVGPGASVGPFARLRPGAALGGQAKVGNFVEIKNAVIEVGAKVSHLSYIGDAHVGAGANIGAGVITCNYDGFSKYRTQIGAGAFIGSNSALVAPVTIGPGAYVGSGSVITKDVEADALGVARARQTTIERWAQKFRARALAQKAAKVQ